eukprot:TRINITY_DN10363_c0_g1_i1.p1 TRINITY_DN10363_c0_g1~~TRINITY_DN10363_c0_g1_i1.p1  ORF type:complete len:479 (-),score=96.11 TRINITY_DN10363_c0_g1_i1:314-1750(-)
MLGTCGTTCASLAACSADYDEKADEDAQAASVEDQAFRASDSNPLEQEARWASMHTGLRVRQEAILQSTPRLQAWPEVCAIPKFVDRGSNASTSTGMESPRTASSLESSQSSSEAAAEIQRSTAPRPSASEAEGMHKTPTLTEKTFSTMNLNELSSGQADSRTTDGRESTSLSPRLDVAAETLKAFKDGVARDLGDCCGPRRRGFFDKLVSAVEEEAHKEEAGNDPRRRENNVFQRDDGEPAVANVPPKPRRALAISKELDAEFVKVRDEQMRQAEWVRHQLMINSLKERNRAEVQKYHEQCAIEKKEQEKRHKASMDRRADRSSNDVVKGVIDRQLMRHMEEVERDQASNWFEKSAFGDDMTRSIRHVLGDSERRHAQSVHQMSMRAENRRDQAELLDNYRGWWETWEIKLAKVQHDSAGDDVRSAHSSLRSEMTQNRDASRKQYESIVSFAHDQQERGGWNEQPSTPTFGSGGPLF